MIGCSPNCGGGGHIQACPNHPARKAEAVPEFDAEGYDPGTLGYMVRRSRWLLAQAQKAGIPTTLAEQLEQLEEKLAGPRDALIDEIRSWRDQ